MPIQYPPGFGEAPDFAGSYIAGRRLAQRDQALQQQDRSLDLEEERNQISRFSTTMSAAMNAKDEETAGIMYRLGMGEDPPKGMFSGLGETGAKVTFEGMTVEGPRSKVRQFFSELADDPSWLSDEKIDLGGDVGEVQKNLGFITRWTEKGLNISFEGDKKDERTEFMKTLDYYNKLDPKSKTYAEDKKFTEGRLRKMAASQGFRITRDEHGNLTIEQGDLGAAAAKPGAPGLTPPAQQYVDKELLKETNRYFRLRRIAKKYRPEFQQLVPRWKAMWTKVKAKLGSTAEKEGILGKLDKQETKFLEDYQAYRMEALDNLNRYIQEITGAQMSVAEAARLTKGMPDPGMGLFDGDDPYSFERKLNTKLDYLENIIARYHYVQKHGMGINVDENGQAEFFLGSDGKPIEPEDMPYIIRQRAMELKKAGKNKEETTRILAQDFGLVPGYPSKPGGAGAQTTTRESNRTVTTTRTPLP